MEDVPRTSDAQDRGVAHEDVHNPRNDTTSPLNNNIVPRTRQVNALNLSHDVNFLMSRNQFESVGTQIPPGTQCSVQPQDTKLEGFKENYKTENIILLPGKEDKDEQSISNSDLEFDGCILASSDVGYITTAMDCLIVNDVLELSGTKYIDIQNTLIDVHGLPLSSKTVDEEIDLKTTAPEVEQTLVPDIVIIKDNGTTSALKTDTQEPPTAFSSAAPAEPPDIVINDDFHSESSSLSRSSSIFSVDSRQNNTTTTSFFSTERLRGDAGSCSRSTSVCSYDSQETASAHSPVGSFTMPPEFPMPPVKVEVASMTVHEGGTGVHNGHLMNFTLNQFIGLVPGEKGKKSIDPKVMKDIVTDAVKLNTQTKKQFLAKDRISFNIPGSKQDMVKAQKRCCCLVFGVVLLVSIVPLVSTALYSILDTSYTSHNSLLPQPLPPVHGNDSEDIGDLAEAPRIFPRSFWVAQPPTGILDNNTLPVKTVIVCHTATEGCTTTPDCVYDVRVIQQYHIESRKWYDIGYSFLIGGDGNVYEGRGWDKMGAHTKGHNNGTLGIAFIGTYINQLPSDEMVDAFNRLVNVGVMVGKISANYSLVAQCQLTATAAPGLALATNMSSWPHYDMTLPVRCPAF